MLIILHFTQRHLDPVIFNVIMEASSSLYDGHCLFPRTNSINQEIFYLCS